jgi:hypothetical protein
MTEPDFPEKLCGNSSRLPQQQWVILTAGINISAIIIHNSINQSFSVLKRFRETHPDVYQYQWIKAITLISSVTSLSCRIAMSKMKWENASKNVLKKWGSK